MCVRDRLAGSPIRDSTFDRVTGKIEPPVDVTITFESSVRNVATSLGKRNENGEIPGLP